MKWARITIGFYFIGIMVFLTIADMDNYYWSYAYYIWDKLKDMILIAAIYDLLKKYRPVIRWMLWYSIIRVIWDIISMATGWSVNHHIAVRVLFICMAIVFIGLSLKDIRQWQKLR